MNMNSAASALSGATAAPAAAPAAAPIDGAAAAAPAAAPASAPAAGSDAPWFAGISNPDVKTWVEAKGFKDPLGVAESAYNLEKLIGFDKAGKTVVIPDENSSPETRKAFLTKLGVPENADGYKLAGADGQPSEFSKSASQWFHENGVPAKAAEGIVAKFNEYQTAQQAVQQQAMAVKSEQEFAGLKSEWGATFDQNIELGKRAAMEFIPGSREERAAALSAMEQAIGTGALMKLMANIGKGLGEHKVVGGEGGSSLMSPAQATQRISELKSNKDWAAAYLAGDKQKATELQNLIAMANAGQV
ncbi:hypothetical protein UFOVP16_33 [uncultured Caudovirales phage]|uniref:Uncharacterized protein n=1 Tax=uncultured Caudovirales phage TaxID=2100421 RepID=A0A6J5KP54_9CAUD|nr:hypothetical protein UFOVP16_33 [uncultured Caudovirales phage]